MKADHNQILAARNRTKRQCKHYLYEAQVNILRAMGSECIGKRSASEMVFAIVSCFLEQIGKEQSFLSAEDVEKMYDLRFYTKHGKRRRLSQGKNGKTHTYNTKRKAQQLLNRAIKAGRIRRPETCSRCGVKPRNRKRSGILGHHHNYSKPYSVTWVCERCHKELHVIVDRAIAHKK